MALSGSVSFVGSKHGSQASGQRLMGSPFLPQQVQCLNLELWLQSLSVYPVSSFYCFYTKAHLFLCAGEVGQLTP